MKRFLSVLILRLPRLVGQAQETDGQENREGWTRHRGGFRDYTKSAPMLLLEGCLLSLTPLSPNLQEASDGRGYCWPKR